MFKTLFKVFIILILPLSNLHAVNIVQVVLYGVAYITGAFNGDYHSIPGLNATIFPSSNKSRVLVDVRAHASTNFDVDDSYLHFKLSRNGTDIGLPDPYQYTITSLSSVSCHTPYLCMSSFSYLDSPDTLDPVNYQLWVASTGFKSTSPAREIFINSQPNFDTKIYDFRTISSITLTEIPPEETLKTNLPKKLPSLEMDRTDS